MSRVKESLRVFFEKRSGFEPAGQVQAPTCAKCNCNLSPYEVFAGRIRGLLKPICLGCAFECVVILRDRILPAVTDALEAFTFPEPWDLIE